MKKFYLILAMLFMVVMLTGCTEADHVNYNISKQAD